MTDAELELLLENWGRWCREHQHWGHCTSIEHKWRTPQEWHEPGAPKSPAEPVLSVFALQVNAAWRVVPEPYKAVLSDWYVYHANPSRTCRRLAIRFVAHGEYLRRARLMCRNVLTRNGVSGIHAPDIADSA